MENSKGSKNIRNFMYSGKHALLPPKSPYPIIPSTYSDHVPNNIIGSKAVQKPREGNAHHQRTSSEGFLMDEQPSWLDDLLNEPDTPVRKGGHRRSSSDSFAYVDVGSVAMTDYAAQDDYRFKNMISAPSWGSQDFDYYNPRDARRASFFNDSIMMKQNRAWDSHSVLSSRNHQSGVPLVIENVVPHGSGNASLPREAEIPSTARQDSAESVPQDAKASEKKDISHSKSSVSDTDTKRAKQQFAQRSRVRKLQYIAELERNVQALQAEGSEVSAELEFFNQQNLILSMENKALKQRLESLAQEQAIKYLEHEVLEREIGRLRALYQQQQQQQQNPHQQQQKQPSTSHRRARSRDLDSQFANLSVKHKDAGPGRDPRPCNWSSSHLGS